MVIMAPRNRHRRPPAVSDSDPDSKPSSKRGVPVDKSSDEYRRKRERNNLAVKKSRSKSKLKTQETLERVNKLRAENEMLEAKIKLLSKELGFLKDLFLAHAGSAHGDTLQDIDLSMFGEAAEAADPCPDGHSRKATVKTE